MNLSEDTEPDHMPHSALQQEQHRAQTREQMRGACASKPIRLVSTGAGGWNNVNAVWFSGDHDPISDPVPHKHHHVPQLIQGAHSPMPWLHSQLLDAVQWNLIDATQQYVQTGLTNVAPTGIDAYLLVCHLAQVAGGHCRWAVRKLS